MTTDKPKPPPPDWEETKKSARAAGKALLVPAIILSVLAGITFTVPLWQRGAFPKTVAESTPHGLIQTEGNDPGSWDYVDADLQRRPLGECVDIDGWRLQRPWQCTSADGSHVFTFRDVRRGGLKSETLVVDGTDVPISCTRTGDWGSLYYCAPLSAIPGEEK